MGYFLAAILGYLLGCSNLAYYLSRAFKRDIRKDGSGNLGASNATILFGWKAGASVAVHDIGKAVDHEVEGSHAAIGADILRKHNEPQDVVQAVAAHHAEVEPNGLYDVLINACDTLSASRPGARSETTELYLKRLEQLETIARDFPGVESCFALQAGREIRVVVVPEKVSEGEAQILARDICSRIEKEMTYPGQIKVTIIRETRSVEYAK
jgi:ribonuclease Y